MHKFWCQDGSVFKECLWGNPQVMGLSPAGEKLGDFRHLAWKHEFTFAFSLTLLMVTYVTIPSITPVHYSHEHSYSSVHR